MGLFSDHKAKKESCCGGHTAAGEGAKDPVCGMTVNPAGAAATRESRGRPISSATPVAPKPSIRIRRSTRPESRGGAGGRS